MSGPGTKEIPFCQNPPGKFVQAKMELSQIGRTRLAQRQLFMCVLREQESEGSMLCNNQFLNLLGGAVFIGVTPANACVPAKLQFFAQYRFLQETTYGPAYGESLDFPGLTDCNGGFPKVLNVECNFTADGGTELGYLVTQEFLRLEFQGDFNGTASENGRFVRTGFLNRAIDFWKAWFSPLLLRRVFSHAW